MVVTYYYRDSSRPPEAYAVQFESDDEVRKAVEWLVSQKLNNGTTTYRMETGIGVAPKYINRANQ